MLRLLVCFVLTSGLDQAFAATTTWDGKHSTESIKVTAVYFVPSDRQPLPDWRERVDYYCRRIEQFHRREFGTQSTLHTDVLPEPFISEHTTDTLRVGDANGIFFRTLSETDRRLAFGQSEDPAFRILLVLSDINWRPLDDFYRLHRSDDGQLSFEGNVNRGQHFPGAASGGARATYLANRRIGWGLVSGDGWRVPYRGSDCVVYHEGCGHTVGLPHPEPGNGSVMSMGQYEGWISESWLDKEQKSRMGWQPESSVADGQLQLFTHFKALPEPVVPVPGQPITLKLNWPVGAKVKSLRVRLQTSIDGAWIEIPQQWSEDAPTSATLGRIDRPTPISYRVDAQLVDGETAELWGYFQVRDDVNSSPLPEALSQDLFVRQGQSTDGSLASTLPANELDVLALVDPAKCWQTGSWTKKDNVLCSPKAYGARIELPQTPPEEYRMTVIAEPLDDPNGLILGQISGDSRFVTLLNYQQSSNALSALENIGGRNVGNETTFKGKLFKINRPSQVIVTVRKSGIHVEVDGRTVVNWKGQRSELSQSEYWSTPDAKRLMVGCYDCQYRFHRFTIEPL